MDSTQVQSMKVAFEAIKDTAYAQAQRIAALEKLVRHAARMDIAPDVLQSRAIKLMEAAK